MKYALLATGLLLMLIGGYAVYTGSGIIEVERGWSSVIAGTMAFVGGLLTLGVAWIIKTLEQLHIMLGARESVAMRDTMQQPYDTGEDFASTSDMPIAPMAWPPHTAPTHPALAKAENTFDNVPASETAREPHIVSFERSFHGSITTMSEETLHAETKTPTIAAEPPKTSPSIRELWRRVAKEIDTTSSATRLEKDRLAEPLPFVAATRPAPPSVPESILPTDAHEDAETAIARAGDWLDEALADLDTTFGKTPAPTHIAGGVAHETPEIAEAAGHLDAQMREPAPLAEASEDEPSSAATAEPAVIGRYEAEGTSYTMFADGSIEAQSKRGIARFKSMADLKAYFETQETP